MNAANWRNEVPMKRLLLAALGLGLLAGCPTAAPAPCLIQRPPLGGYQNKFTLVGTNAACPAIFADNLRWDKYTDGLVVAKSDSMPYTNTVPDQGGDPDPAHSPTGRGTMPDEPTSSSGLDICTVPTLTHMQSDTSFLGALQYDFTEINFLDGARYQGSEYEAKVHVVMDACEADYTSQALTPSVFCGVDDDCNPLAEPDKGRAVGSGLNPDFAIACIKDDWVITYVTGDPSTGLCFFTKPFPGLTTQ
jgi:hypothetical protein